jgi:hypothetical protein
MLYYLRKGIRLSQPSIADVQAGWTLLGREMCRECQKANHHFRCAAAPVQFHWLIKHSIFVSANSPVRLWITKGTARSAALAEFTIHLYVDNAEVDTGTLSIDAMGKCSFDGETWVSVRDICQHLVTTLCNPCARPTLTLSLLR